MEIYDEELLLGLGGALPTLPQLDLNAIQTFSQELIYTDQLLQQVCIDVQMFRCEYNDFTEAGSAEADSMSMTSDGIEAEVNYNMKIEVLERLNAKIYSIKMQTRNILYEKFPQNINCLNLLGAAVIQKLACWKRDQQLAANGAPTTHLAPSLDSIERDFLLLTNAVSSMRSQRHIIQQYLVNDGDPIQELRYPELREPLNNIHERLTDFWYNLVANSFVVETQPPQVVKTGLQFQTSVRLIGTHRKLIMLSEGDVTVHLITQRQAQQVQEHELNPATRRQPINMVSQDITNNRNGWQERNNTKVAEFARVQIPKIRRQRENTNGNESVLEDKMALLFIGLALDPTGEIIELRAVSLPLVVVVHHNQDALAWATITWDNQFGIMPRDYFAVPDEKPWCDVASALNLKFTSKTRSVTDTRRLDENDLIMLANKFFRGAAWNELSPVSWSSLTRAQLPSARGRPAFTFWEWFYALMVALDKCKHLWNRHLIKGFVSKQDAESALAQPGVQPGTFLVRFSDTQLGGITVVHRTTSALDTKQEFEHMLYDSKDLEYKPLADRIIANDKLTTLYPNHDKTVFEPFCTRRDNTDDRGYKRPT